MLPPVGSGGSDTTLPVCVRSDSELALANFGSHGCPGMAPLAIGRMFASSSVAAHSMVAHNLWGGTDTH